MGKQGYTTADPNDIRMLKPFPPPDIPAGAMHMPYSSNQNIGDTNGADIQEMMRAHEAKWPQSARDEHKANGGFFAGSGTSFPLKDSEDVRHAAHLYGHSDDKVATKSKIISFAKSHGFTSDLPKEWTEADDGDGDDDDQIKETHSKIRQLCP